MKRLRSALRPWRLSIWLGLLLLSTIGCLPWSSVGFPNVDLADMVYQVRRLQLGYVPYRDSFNHHFAGYLIPFYLVSMVVPLTPLWVKVGTVALNFFITVLTFLSLSELTERRSVAWLGALTGATTGWFWGWGAYALNVQSVLAPLLASLIYLTIRSTKRECAHSFYAAAFVFGLLVVADQRDLAFGPMLLVAPWTRLRLRTPVVLARATLAGALVPIACIILLLLSSATVDFVQQTLVFPFQHRNNGLQGTVFQRAILTSVQLLVSEPVAIVAAITGLLMLVCWEQRTWLAWLFLLGIAGAYSYVLLGGRPYVNYYLMCGPFVLLLMALNCEYALRWSGSAGVVVGTLLCVKAIAFLFAAVSFLSQRSVLAETERPIREVASFVKAHSGPGDPVLVWGFAPQIYVMSERLNTFKDQGLLSVAGANFQSEGDQPSAVPQMVDEFKTFLERTPPTLFVKYTVKENRGICWGKGELLKNFDYMRVPRLAYVRDEVQAAYQRVFATEGLCDMAEVFMRRRPQ